MKKIIQFSVSCVVSFLASITYAAPVLDANNFYAGIGFGRFSYNTEVEVGAFQRADYDEYEKVNFKGLIGLKLDEQISVEMQYINLDKDDFTVNNGSSSVPTGRQASFVFGDTRIQNGIRKTSFEGESFGFSALYQINLTSKIKPYVKLGLHSWERTVTNVTAYDAVKESSVPLVGSTSTITLTAVDAETLTDSNTTDDVDLFYGVGLMLPISEYLSTRFEYEAFRFDNNEADNFSVSVIYDF